MITAFHPYSTVEVQFVHILMSAPGEKVVLPGEKRRERVKSVTHVAFGATGAKRRLGRATQWRRQRNGVGTAMA
jgi:hypothetical protein